MQPKTNLSKESVMRDAEAAGLIVQACHDDNFIAVRADKAPEGTQERMRMTSNGSLFTVSDGYYWQIGTVEDVANYVRSKQ